MLVDYEHCLFTHLQISNRLNANTWQHTQCIHARVCPLLVPSGDENLERFNTEEKDQTLVCEETSPCKEKSVIANSPSPTAPINFSRRTSLVHMSLASIREYGHSWGGIGRTGAPPGAPLERSPAMMEGRNATMIFHRISTYRVLRWQ